METRERLEKNLIGKMPFDIDKKKIVIWGCGNTAVLYQNGLKRIQEKLRVYAYCDSNPELWGNDFFGKKVLSPEQVLELTDVAVCICSPQEKVVDAISQKLRDMGIVHCHLDEVIFKIYKDIILENYDLITDEKSKVIYANIIETRMNGRNPHEDLVSDNQYFAVPCFTYNNPNEIFVDCGAFVGDSIESFIQHREGVFKKIYAIEPDSVNITAMKKRLARLHEEWNIPTDSIEIYNVGISEKCSSMKVARSEVQNGLSSKIVEYSEETGEHSEIEIVSLDCLIKEPISFLKADIEGFEYNMVLGGQECISQYKPKIAVCIYHNAVDVFSIQQILHKIVPDYKFSIRQHSYQNLETVLYAYV